MRSTEKSVQLLSWNGTKSKCTHRNR